eukprot:PhM_4_TR14983/c0_g1_i1/m.63726/K14771/NOC4, UTP19; U3 small nucleolar RNA-associated protein 19
MDSFLKELKHAPTPQRVLAKAKLLGPLVQDVLLAPLVSQQEVMSGTELTMELHRYFSPDVSRLHAMCEKYDDMCMFVLESASEVLAQPNMPDDIRRVCVSNLFAVVHGVPLTSVSGRTTWCLELKKSPRVDNSTLAADFGFETKSDAPTAERIFAVEHRRDVFTSVWCKVLAGDVLPLPLRRHVLKHIDETVFPVLTSPTILFDLLVAQFDQGGIDAAYALRGVFILILHYNLEFPRFFEAVYALLDEDVINSKHALDILPLVGTFISGPRITDELVAAFARKLSYLSRSAPAHVAQYIMFIVCNLMRTNHSAVGLVHWGNPVVDYDDDDDADEDEEGSTEEHEEKEEAAAVVDTDTEENSNDDDDDSGSEASFDPDTRKPSECRADRSMCWEAEHLLHHPTHTVRSTTQILCEDPTRPVIRIDKSLMSYESLMRSEMAECGTTTLAFTQCPGEFIARGAAFW